MVFPSNATGHVRHGKHIYCKISNSQSIVAKCLAADEQTKTFLERKYGRKTLQCLTLEYEDEKATEKWKSENTGPARVFLERQLRWATSSATFV